MSENQEIKINVNLKPWVKPMIDSLCETLLGLTKSHGLPPKLAAEILLDATNKAVQYAVDTEVDFT